LLYRITIIYGMICRAARSIALRRPKAPGATSPGGVFDGR
jgi:hypothetical protein